jgi:hypothetical protein
LLSDGDSGLLAAISLDIDYRAGPRDGVGMITRALMPALAIVLCTAFPAVAQCYADYKAKQDNPLRLQYGVAELPSSACGNAQAAAAHIAPRLERDGWILLQIVSTFGPEGLESRRDDAGRFFLRY